MISLYFGIDSLGIGLFFLLIILMVAAMIQFTIEIQIANSALDVHLSDLEKHQDWQALQGEIWCEKSISDEYLLQGQIDRIDQYGRHLGVIDYITGTTIASGKSVENGKAVQLPFYALLKSQISQVEYLPLGDRDKVKSKVIIRGANLTWNYDI